MEMPMGVAGYIHAFWVPKLDDELSASRPIATQEEDPDTHQMGGYRSSLDG
jgi:hypothetical protein